MVLLGSLSISGCHNFQPNDKAVKGITLPKTQMDHDSVAVRVAVAELDESQQEPFERFIATADAQKLPLRVRRKLDENGLRVTVVSSANSMRIQELLRPIQLKPEWFSGQQQELAQAGKLPEISRLKTHRHVEKKRGESLHVKTSPIQSSVSWCIYDGQRQDRDAATTAQGQMKITGWPQVDGTVRLDFVPEIHYGENLSRVGVNGKDLAVEQRREIKPLQSLAFSINVRMGETVVVAPTETFERSGKLLFCTGSDDEHIGQATENGSPLAEEDSEQEQLLLEHFPMLDDDSNDVSIKVGSPTVEMSEPAEGPPKPWRRFLMVRLVRVTPPIVNHDRLRISQ